VRSGGRRLRWARQAPITRGVMALTTPHHSRFHRTDGRTLRSHQPLTVLSLCSRSGSDQSGRPDLNRRPLDPQECIHEAAASVNVRLRRSRGAWGSGLKQEGALLSRTRSRLRSHLRTRPNPDRRCPFTARDGGLSGAAASPTATPTSGTRCDRGPRLWRARSARATSRGRS
jgi:hypothetical protein